MVNTVIGPISFPLNYHGTYYVSATIRYYLTEKFALQAGASFDHSPTPEDNLSLLLPEGNTTTVGIGLEYKFQEKYALDLNIGYGFNRNSIQLMNNNDVRQFGSVENQVYYLSLELTYDD